MDKCFTCGGPKTQTKNGTWYCRPCRRSIGKESGQAGSRGRKLLRTHCVNGHEFTPANTIHRPDGGRRCRTCNNTRSPQWFARQKERRKQINAERRREREEWFDWVVVYRIVSKGEELPGRMPTIAEWRKVFELLPAENNEQIAARVGVDVTTVRRYRARTKEGNHAAA